MKCEHKAGDGIEIYKEYEKPRLGMMVIRCVECGAIMDAELYERSIKGNYKLCSPRKIEQGKH